MPEYEKVTRKHLLDIVDRCSKADVTATHPVSIRVLASMAMELIQLRAEKECRCFDEGKPSVCNGGQNYSLAYANPEDLDGLN